MKIFGHKWIESEKFYAVQSIEDINKTPANSVLELEALSKSWELAKYCQQNILVYALKINTIEDAMLANLLKAKYLLCQKELAKELMPIAQHYLFDTQILTYIQSDEIEEMAKFGVDGVIIS